MYTLEIIQKFKDAGFTKCQIKVMYQICQGNTSKLAASNLKITESTVKYHLTKMFTKAEVKNRSNIIIWERSFLARF